MKKSAGVLWNDSSFSKHETNESFFALNQTWSRNISSWLHQPSLGLYFNSLPIAVCPRFSLLKNRSMNVNIFRTKNRYFTGDVIGIWIWTELVRVFNKVHPYIREHKPLQYPLCKQAPRWLWLDSYTKGLIYKISELYLNTFHFIYASFVFRVRGIVEISVS